MSKVVTTHQKVYEFTLNYFGHHISIHVTQKSKKLIHMSIPSKSHIIAMDTHVVMILNLISGTDEI